LPALTPTWGAAKAFDMPPVSSRLAAAAALALLAACGGKSSTPPAPPGPLQLACSVSLSGPATVLNVLARATTKAAAGAPGITVTLQTQPLAQALTLSGPAWAGSKEVRGASVSAGSWVSAAATIDGVPVTSSCIAYAGLPPVNARAIRTATGADLAWDAVPGAATYRWSLRDGPDGALIASGSTSTTSAQAVATLGLTTPYVAEVGAYALTGAETSYPTPLPIPAASFGRALFTSGNGGGDGGSAWQFFGPGDFVNGTLTVGFPALGANERVAVLLDNAGGDDASYATVSVVGTGTALLAPAAPLAAMAAAQPAAGSAADFDRSDVMAGEALVATQREEIMARLRDGRLQRQAPAAKGPLAAVAAAAALPATRSFCQGRISAAGSWSYVWTGATLAYETAHAAFYYANDVKTGIDQALSAANRPDFFITLGDAYESRILGALNTYFGAETDVDGNGKMVFLFGNLGKTTAGGFVVGYFSPADLELPLANASSCSSGRGGNQTDMLYLLDPATFTTNWAGKGANYKAVLDLILNGEYQGVMAHELQHDVNYATHCSIGGACGVDEELWLNEGLSMLSETVAGYGLHGTSSRSAVRYYQGTLSATGLPYYQGYSMTAWAGDAIGNYAGVQAYMQYLLDHASPAMTTALQNKWLAGKANVEAATGVPWELGFARFATAAMFSNEDTSAAGGALGSITSAGNLLANPVFNYLGDGVAPDYVPWHRMTGNCGTTPVPRTAYVAWTPVNGSAGATLRRDGWAALATGPGSGGAATIRVQSSAGVRPHVVVVKYTGALSNYVAPTCP